jgi:uncharacterized protein
MRHATRASWKVGHRRAEVQYALAVFEGIVREVYEIKEWFPSGTTFNSRFPHGDKRGDRWEFIGRLANDRLRRRATSTDLLETSSSRAHKIQLST